MRTIWPASMGVTLALFGAVTQAQVGSQREVRLSIERQALRDALNEWAQQTGFELVAEVPGARFSPRIDGTLTPRAALEQLLAGTSLTFEWLNDRVVAVREQGSSPDKSRMVPGEGEQPRLLLAQLQNVPPASQTPDSKEKRTDQAKDTSSRDSAAFDSIETVLVTAQKRQERLQEVPISISVLSGNALDQSTVQGVTEALNTVPGVTAQESYIGGGTQISVRGVSGSSPILHGSSPIAYYLDSVPFGLIKTSIAPDSNAYDLQRVEVLRGPQGTLYGASALNGVVRVLTNDANPGDFEFKARSGVSSTEGGDVNYRADAAINIPIVADKLAARAVAGYQDLSGWIERPNRNDVNSAEIKNLRLKVNARPVDALSIGLSTWISRDDRDAPPQSRENDFHAIAAEEPQSSRYDAYGLTIGYDFASFTIASMSSYLKYENRGVLNLGELGLTGFEFVNKYFAEVLSEELTLNSNSAGPWRWALGGIYRDEQDRTLQTLVGLFPAPIDFDDSSRSFAAYGEITRVLLDGRLELTAGLRYFEDEVSTHENTPGSGVSGTPLINATSTFEKITPRAVVTWLPNEDFTVYASWGEGFRSGFQQQPNVVQAAPQIPPVDADSLTNYEIGSKGRLLSDRISYEAAVYYIEWEDVQSDSSILINGLPVAALVNGDSASGIGFDLSLIVRPVEGLNLGVTFSTNDLTYDSDVFSGGAVLFPKGSRLSMSPRRSVGGFLGYSFPVGGGGYAASISASANYSSSQFIKIPSGFGQGDSILVARSNVTISAPSNWEFSVYADNLTNEDGAIQRAPFVAPDWAVRPVPRTIGVQVEYRY